MPEQKVAFRALGADGTVAAYFTESYGYQWLVIYVPESGGAGNGDYVPARSVRLCGRQIKALLDLLAENYVDRGDLDD